MAQGLAGVAGAVALFVAIRGVWFALRPPRVEGLGGIGAVSSGTAETFVLVTPALILLGLGLRVVARRGGALAARFRRIQVWSAVLWIGWTILSARWLESAWTRSAGDLNTYFQAARLIRGVDGVLLSVQVASALGLLVSLVGNLGRGQTPSSGP